MESTRQKPAPAIPAPAKLKGGEPFQPGNQLWKLRAFHGSPRIYEDPDKLWSDCCDYFDWATKNSIKSTHVSAFEGVVTKTKVRKTRAMTINGLCVFLNISGDAWAYLAKHKNPQIRAVRETVMSIIKEQKFTAAAAGELNAMLIARDLGLKDGTVSEVHSTSTSLNLSASELKGLTDDELAQLERLLSRAEAAAERESETGE